MSCGMDEAEGVDRSLNITSEWGYIRVACHSGVTRFESVGQWSGMSCCGAGEPFIILLLLGWFLLIIESGST